MRRTAALHRTLALAVAGIGALPAAPASGAVRYAPCEPVPGSVLVQAARVACADARLLAAAVVAAPVRDTGAAVRAAGWTPVRSRTSRARALVHDVVAVRRRAAVRIRRAGVGPDLDGWAAGRELIFARGTIVGGAPVPRGTATCTSAFLVRLRGGRKAGLSAAHCAGLRRNGRVARRNAALRRPPEPGIVLGRVRRMLTRRAPLDALALPAPGPARHRAAPVIDRGVSRPPWVVAGTGRPLAGRRVCFTGRSSGIDRCGRIRGRGARPAERFLASRAGLVVRCTTIRARSGDSGGPVFTSPSSNGTVRAIGIVTLVVGRRSRMCFTPLLPVLDHLGAEVVTG